MLPKGLMKEYSRALSMMIRILDTVVIIAAAVIAYDVRFGSILIPAVYVSALLIAAFATPIIFSFCHVYASIRGAGFISHIATLTQALFLLSLVLAGLAFFTKSGELYSRAWFICWMVIAEFCLVLCRCGILLLLRSMRSLGLNERAVVIFGAGELGIKLAKTVQQALWTGFRIVTFIDDHADSKPKSLCEIPIIQTPGSLSDYLTQHKIDEIWLALPLAAECRAKKVLYELRHHPINTRFVLDIFGMDLLNHSITDIAGVPVLNIRSTPMVGMNRFLKAIEDRLIASVILILISPLFLLIASIVKLTSKGPIFFKQKRLGWDGRIIWVYKFRSMVLHDEKNGEVQQATQNDSRVTAFGRFLRKTSLDELPQFINVLQGRMSIVGPRPHALSHNEQYKDLIHTYMQRHCVKPGITGWAQVNGWRGETNTIVKMRKRIEYDLYYINNWSLWFDIKIILLTILRGFINRNAY